MALSEKFIPVFVDTLKDRKTTRRFKERFGSYPVLRIHNLKGEEIGGRIDGNRVAGKIPVDQVLKQLNQGLLASKGSQTDKNQK